MTLKPNIERVGMPSDLSPLRPEERSPVARGCNFIVAAVVCVPFDQGMSYQDA